MGSYTIKKILLSLVAQRELKHNGGIQVMYSEIITSHLNEMVADCGYIENVKRKKSGTYTDISHKKLVLISSAYTLTKQNLLNMILVLLTND